MKLSAQVDTTSLTGFDRTLLTLIGVGILARVASLIALAGQPLDPDAGHYLRLANEFSWSAFFAASYREPLWVGLLNLAIRPFDGDAIGIRIFTTLCSIVNVFVASLFLRRLLHARPARVALALVSLNGLLIFLAPRGLREDVSLLLVLSLGITVVAWVRRPTSRSALIAATTVGLLALIRWETAILILIALIAAAAIYRRALVPVIACTLAAALVSTPWLWSNASRFGNPFDHTSYSATWFYSQELKEREGIPPIKTQQTVITWQDYYLEIVGPAETTRRAVIGFPLLVASYLYQWVYPIRADRLIELVPAAVHLVPFLRIAATGFVALSILLIGVALWKERLNRATWVLVAASLLFLAPYAPLYEHLDVNYRLVVAATPFVAALIATGTVHMWRIASRSSETESLIATRSGVAGG